MNQNPEQLARDNIDKQLLRCGWVIQGKKQINLSASIGVAIREYQTNKIGLHNNEGNFLFEWDNTQV